MTVAACGSEDTFAASSLTQVHGDSLPGCKAAGS
jgi:hypothetical protein